MECWYQIAGWIVFLICSLLFVVQSLLARDLLGFSASITFFLGCLLFLIPILRSDKLKQ